MEGRLAGGACRGTGAGWGRCTSRLREMYSRNDIRTEFERDYTRILHCRAYRRLKHKTQVFYAPRNDHVCTRMEHVMHVASAPRMQ